MSIHAIYILVKHNILDFARSEKSNDIAFTMILKN